MVSASSPPLSPDATERPWHALDPSAVERLLATGPAGLSAGAAASRLAQAGPNQLEEAPPVPLWRFVLRQLRSPLVYILLVANVVTFALGEYVDALAIVAVVVVDVVIGVVQERRSENAVRALARMVSLTARVIRDGRDEIVETQFLVPGDLILLESGDRVPADLRLVEERALEIDESMLTGESLPARKTAGLLPEATELPDRADMAFAGTVVTSGRGRGYAVATGVGTALGAIAADVRDVRETDAPLQKQLHRFGHVVNLTAIIVAVLVFVIGILRNESVFDMFMIGVTVAVSAIPEGLPVTLTIALTVGVRRMAARSAIIRQLEAVETLGSLTCIGTDKTGTLTENRMTVRRIWTPRTEVSVVGDRPGDDSALEPALRLTLLTGIVANEARIEREAGEWLTQGDPTEIALLNVAIWAGIDPVALRLEHPSLEEIPFESDHRFSANIRRFDGQRVVFVKGAPERVLEMCEHQQDGDDVGPFSRAEAEAAARAMARDGLRVLAMAYGPAPETAPVPASPGFRDLIFLGLVGMIDPPRVGVPEAIARCRAEGIRVIMMTGDHPETAQSIGRQIGLVADGDQVVTGSQLREMDETALQRRVPDVSIYARISPDQKLRIVRALQAAGEIVAVTGDGVNDAPALKAADVGIAMGKDGTDAAREAADMVLTDDNFVTIAAAIDEGRSTFSNIQKVTFFLVGTGAAELLTILSVMVLGWQLPFVPIQLLWLNLVTDGLQVVALAFEPADPEHTGSRPANGAILSRLLWQRAALSAVVLTAGTLALFRWDLGGSSSLVHAQTIALTAMVIFQAFQAWNARSETRSIFRLPLTSNRFLFYSIAGALAVHILAIYLPPARSVLHLEPISAGDWVRIVLVASTIILVVEIEKAVRRRLR